jgi:lipopolysaccharide export system permease protein
MLRRYVALEVFRPFLAWTALFAMIFLVMAFFRGVDVLLGSAVTLGDLVRFLGYLVPQLLVQSIPVAFLLAILIGFGRLSEDGELGALSALGISPAALLLGPLVLSGVLVVALGILMSTAQPWGQTMVRRAANEIIRRNLMSDIKPGTFHEEVHGLTLYVGEGRKGGNREHVLLHDERDRDHPLLVVAERGKVRPAEAADAIAFDLEHGTVHRGSSTNEEYTTIAFEEGSIRAEIGEAVSKRNQFQTARDEQTPLELWRSADDAAAAGTSPQRWLVSFWWRIGQMLMPLAFACVAVPLAIKRKGGRASGVVFALAAYVGFFVLARWAVDMGDAGRLPAAFAGLFSNLVFAGAGLVAMHRVVRRGLS